MSLSQKGKPNRPSSKTIHQLKPTPSAIVPQSHKYPIHVHVHSTPVLSFIPHHIKCTRSTMNLTQRCVKHRRMISFTSQGKPKCNENVCWLIPPPKKCKDIDQIVGNNIVLFAFLANEPGVSTVGVYKDIAKHQHRVDISRHPNGTSPVPRKHVKNSQRTPECMHEKDSKTLQTGRISKVPRRRRIALIHPNPYLPRRLVMSRP